MALINTILISCEHGGNQIPIRYRSLFNEASLQESAAWNEGALDLAFTLAERLDVPCFTHQTSRLLVDVDLPLGNSALFTLDSASLSDADKQSILERYYFPYRLRIENTIAMSDKPLLHLSVHTTSVQIADLMIKFNGNRVLEKECTMLLMDTISKAVLNVNVALQAINTSEEDSFVHYLRTRFDDEAYAGLTLIFHTRLSRNENITMLVEEFSKALTLLRS